jgi:integrase
MAERIDDKLVKRLLKNPPAKGNAITYDDELTGFGARITAGGTLAFVMNYRLDGSEWRYTIGQYPEWSVTAARDEVKKLRRRIDKGDNPMAERRERQEADTVRDLAHRFEAEFLPKRSKDYQHEAKVMLENDILPVIGRMMVTDVRRKDMDKIHRLVSERAPIRANRVIAVASKMFSMAIRWDRRSDNPCKGIERNQENRRSRYLSQREIADLSAALVKYPSQNAADCLRFILLTGCRKAEAMTATWDQFDLERGVWTKPSAHTKQKKEHRVPLSALALALLRRIRAKAEEGIPHVFPGRKRGEPIQQIRTAWEFVIDRAGLKDVRIHDLRHTYASILASAGVSLPLVGALLGHTQPATTARYAHLYDDPLREATERVGAFVTSAGKPAAPVVPAKGGAA